VIRMNLPLAHNAKLRSSLPSLILAALCFYFAFYLIFGGRGLVALGRLEDTSAQRKTEYAELKDRRGRIEANVHLMRPNSLDPDMADEQVRRGLGYTKPDEIVIHLN
jgi:cell division protein FtsB